MENTKSNEEQKFLKRTITTEEYVDSEKKENEEIKKEENKTELSQISKSGYEIKNLSNEAKEILFEIEEFSKVSKIISDELPDSNEKQFAVKAAKISALTDNLKLQSLKNAYKLQNSEQCIILEKIFIVQENVFESIEAVKKKDTTSWFSNMTSELESIFDYAENEKLSVIESKEILARNLSVWLVLVRIISKKGKRANKTNALKMKENYSKALKIMKKHNDKEFGKKVLRYTKDIKKNSKGKEIQDFLEEDVLGAAKEANKLLSKCDKIFQKTFEEMQNNILKFTLPAMKINLIVTPVEKLLQGIEILEEMIFERLKKGTGKFIIKGLKNQFDSFNDSVRRAEKLVDIAQKGSNFSPPSMEKLRKLGDSINASFNENELFLQNIESALKISKVSSVVSNLVENSALNKDFFSNYISWWKDLEVISFKKATKDIKGIFGRK
jgi:hypothetical protein